MMRRKKATTRVKERKRTKMKKDLPRDEMTALAPT